jgi:hypothetical protein
MNYTTKETKVIEMLGGDGQDYDQLNRVIEERELYGRGVAEGTVYTIDGVPVLDCQGGGWDIARECPCGAWVWIGNGDPCHQCGGPCPAE